MYVFLAKPVVEIKSLQIWRLAGLGRRTGLFDNLEIARSRTLGPLRGDGINESLGVFVIDTSVGPDLLFHDEKIQRDVLELFRCGGCSR